MSIRPIRKLDEADETTYDRSFMIIHALVSSLLYPQSEQIIPKYNLYWATSLFESRQLLHICEFLG